MALHDLDIEAIPGEKSKELMVAEARGMGYKAWRQIAKDYIAFPLLSGPGGLCADADRQLHRQHHPQRLGIRDHLLRSLPRPVPRSARRRPRTRAAALHLRQLLGSANIEGSPIFHVMAGNLGYQVEHHIFPDMPSSRYAQIAPKVKEICERHKLPQPGRLGKQFFPCSARSCGSPSRWQAGQEAGPYVPLAEDNAIPRPLVSI